MSRELEILDGSHWDLDGFLDGTNYSDKTEVCQRNGILPLPSILQCDECF